MLGLAALAALMAMAIVGASSAMAESTSLCAADEAECAAPLTHVHETTLTGKKAVLKTSIVTVECDVLFLGDTLSESGAPLVIHGTFTYTNCGSCTATEENGPAEVKVLKEGHEAGSVVGEGLVHVECSGLNCRYNGVGLKGAAKGPLLSTETNGEVSLVKQLTNKESGLFCPSTSELTITTTPLSATYLGAEGGGGGGGGENLVILFNTLMNVGDTQTVILENISGADITISGEGWDSLHLEGLGTKCSKVTAGSSCTTRKLKCLEKGEGSYFVTAPGETVSIKVKCD
jgi:hypothetical protein